MNLEKLKDRIKDSGIKKTAIAKQMDIPYITLNRRLRGEGEFTVSQAVNLSRILRLTAAEKNDIFFT